MGVTRVKLANLMRNVDQPGCKEQGVCLCGKAMMWDHAGELRKHRAKLDGGKPRKARKSEWCRVSEILKAAVEAGNASGLPLD